MTPSDDVPGPGGPGLAPLPPFAAWRFVDQVEGFEAVYVERGLLRGHTSAVEDGRAYAVHNEIVVDDARRRARRGCGATPSAARGRSSCSVTARGA